MALTTITVWGATYVVTKGVMSELTAIDVLVTRFTIGFLILAAVAKATGQSLMIQERSDLKLFIASGATGVAAYFTLENCALYFTQAANVGVIVSLIPITNVLVMWFFFRDVPLKRQFFIGSAIAVAGSACLTLATDKLGAVSPLGDLLAFLACFAWPLYCVVSRKLSERGYKIIPMTAWTFSSCCPLISGSGRRSHSRLSRIRESSWDSRSLACSLPRSATRRGRALWSRLASRRPLSSSTHSR